MGKCFAVRGDRPGHDGVAYLGNHRHQGDTKATPSQPKYLLRVEWLQPHDNKVSALLTSRDVSIAAFGGGLLGFWFAWSQSLSKSLETPINWRFVWVTAAMGVLVSSPLCLLASLQRQRAGRWYEAVNRCRANKIAVAKTWTWHLLGIERRGATWVIDCIRDGDVRQRFEVAAEEVQLEQGTLPYLRFENVDYTGNHILLMGPVVVVVPTLQALPRLKDNYVITMQV